MSEGASKKLKGTAGTKLLPCLSPCNVGGLAKAPALRHECQSFANALTLVDYADYKMLRHPALSPTLPTFRKCR